MDAPPWDSGPIQLRAFARKPENAACQTASLSAASWDGSTMRQPIYARAFCVVPSRTTAFDACADCNPHSSVVRQLRAHIETLRSARAVSRADGTVLSDGR